MASFARGGKTIRFSLDKILGPNSQMELASMPVASARTVARNATQSHHIKRKFVLRDTRLADGVFEVLVAETHNPAVAVAKSRQAIIRLRGAGGNVIALAGNTNGAANATVFKKRGGRVFLVPGGQ